MSTLDATVFMLKALPESELLTIYNLTRRFYMKQQMLDKLDLARKHAAEGKVMDADEAVSKLREKYGL